MILAREMLDVELTRDLDDITDWLDRGVVVAGLRHLVEGYFLELGKLESITELSLFLPSPFQADLFLTGAGRTGIYH